MMARDMHAIVSRVQGRADVLARALRPSTQDGKHLQALSEITVLFFSRNLLLPLCSLSPANPAVPAGRSQLSNSTKAEAAKHAREVSRCDVQSRARSKPAQGWLTHHAVYGGPRKVMARDALGIVAGVGNG